MKASIHLISFTCVPDNGKQKGLDLIRLRKSMVAKLRDAFDNYL
jgi:hypothetical protein